MELIKGSIFLSFVVFVFTKLGIFWKTSVTRKILVTAGRGLGVLFGGSAIITFFRRDGRIYPMFLYSGFFKICDRLVNFLPKQSGRLYFYTGDILRASAVFRFISFLAEKMHVCLGVFVGILLVTPHKYWNNVYSLIGVVLLTGLFIIGGMTNKRRFDLRHFGAYFLVFTLCVTIGFIFSLSLSLSLRFFLFYVSAFLLVLLIVSSIKTYGQLQTMLIIVLCAMTIACIYGCYQSVVGVPVVRSQIDLDSSAGTPGRIFSFFDNPNNFGEIIVMLTPFYFAMFLNMKSFKYKLYIILMFIPVVISMLMTYMRFGWVGFAFCIFVFLFFKDWRFLPLCIILLLLSIPVLPRSIQLRLFSMFNMQDTSITYRLEILETMIQPLRKNWFFGVGLGSDIVMRITENFEIVTKSTPVHSHNLYIQIWLEAGFLALISFIASVWRNIKEALTALLNKETPGNIRNFLIAPVASFAGILLICFAEYIWYYPRVMMIFFFVFAVSAAARRLTVKN